MENSNFTFYKRNTRVSNLLLIITGLTLLIIQNVHSMPHRDFKESDSSLHKSELINREREELIEVEKRDDKYLENENEDDNDSKDEDHGSKRSDREHDFTKDKDAIKYPGDWERNEPKNLIPDPLPDCMGKTFCEDTASSYPQDYLSNIISGSESLKLFSGVDQIDLVQRVDSADGGELLCGSEIKIVYPKTAQNGAKEWLFVLQDEKQNYKQGVKVENCDVGTVEGTCKIIEGSIYGYKTFCQQKYVSRVLAAVHKNGTAVTEKFSMPSSCCCQLKLIRDDVGARFGGVTPKNQTPAPMKNNGKAR